MKIRQRSWEDVDPSKKRLGKETGEMIKTQEQEEFEVVVELCMEQHGTISPPQVALCIKRTGVDTTPLAVIKELRKRGKIVGEIFKG